MSANARGSILILRIHSEEITEDVRTRMLTIQEEELDLLKELTGFLNTETRFVEQYLDVLKEAKADWLDE